MGVGDGVGTNSRSSNRKSNAPKTPKITASKKYSKNSLENKLEFNLPKRPKNDSPLPKGIIYFKGLEQFKFHDYSSEVQEYLDSKDKEEKIIVTPFTNHEYALSSALTTLASNKPRLVLVGASGIEKHKMAEYLGKLIVNGKDMYVPPSMNDLLDQVKKNSKESLYSYMFLPNMESPFNVYSISYNNREEMLKDSSIAEEYCRDVCADIYSVVEDILDKKDADKKDDKPSEGKQKKKRTKSDGELLKTLVEDLHKQKEEAQNEASDKLKGWLNMMDSYFTTRKNDIGFAIEDAVRNAHPNKRLRSKIDVRLSYGQNKDQERYPLDVILRPHIISSSNEKVSSIANYVKELFGTFSADDKFCPHSDILSIGKFLDGIVTIIPYMRDFITTTSDVDGDLYVKPLLLEGLKTNIYTLSHQGERFSIESKRILIGYDNVDPFLVLKTGGVEEDETEFRQEIKRVSVHKNIDNTLEARKKTLAVIDYLVDKFNKERSDAGIDKKISLDKDAYNMLLQSLVSIDKVINVEYASLERTIQEIGTYALKKNKTDITKELLIEKKKNDTPPEFFQEINYEDKYGYLLSDMKPKVGIVMGISVYESDDPDEINKASVFKTNSHTFKHNKKDREHNVELVDPKHAMGDEATSKGQELAGDVLKIFFEKYGNGKKYASRSIKTHFKNSWKPEDGGPSASLAIHLSQMSSLTKTPIYQNRIITGTVDPTMIQAEKIGAVYFKSLSAYRLSELNDKTPWYFLFPATNIHDMTKELTWDAFGIEQKITLIPVRSTEEAYHLMTCGEIITEYDRKYAHELGVQKIIESFKKLK
ncbi:MAG TPA: hypothetical protein VEC16_02565 [Alphaproteobacteria bacterium]|nr:hypothetical protein [Alphaproteobacteria bacterium]